MSAELAATLEACRFRTVFLPRGEARADEYEAFVWVEAKRVPQCDVDYVAAAIRCASDAGRAFYLVFRHRKPRDAMKRALAAAGIHAERGTLQ